MMSLLGGILIVAGIVLGGNMPVIIVGAVLLGLGQTKRGKAREQKNQQAYDALVPDIVGNVFENVEMDPKPHILDAQDTNISLPEHSYCSGSGYIRGSYHGLTAELCTIQLTKLEEFQREETGLWEKNEHEVYTGQWMLCELGERFSTWLTVRPRDKMDKLLHTKTIKTGNAAFDQRFNLISDNEAEALRILNGNRIEQILALAEQSFGKFAFNLNCDGRLYIAVHSGHAFFDIGKGKESPEQLRQRYVRELHWFTDLVDVFRLA